MDGFERRAALNRAEQSSAQNRAIVVETPVFYECNGWFGDFNQIFMIYSVWKDIYNFLW